MASTQAQRFLPAVDDYHERFIAFSSPRRVVEFSPALAQFLATAVADVRVPILVTQERAELSPHIASELARAGGRWVVTTAGRGVVDVLSNRRLSRLDDVLDDALLASLPAGGLDPHDDNLNSAVLGLDIVAHHLPTADAQMGRLAVDICSFLGEPAPDTFGFTEPLTLAWSVERQTELARAAMPASPRYLVSSPRDIWFTLSYDRGPDGVFERLRGWAYLGLWSAWDVRVPAHAERLLQHLRACHTLVSASATLIDAGYRGRLSAHRRVPESQVAQLGVGEQRGY